MCINCYEAYDSPAIINDNTRRAAELIEEVYEHWGCSAGGYGHIVFDDWNLKDGNIDFCIEQAKSNSAAEISNEGRTACIEALEFFKQLSEPERAAALAMVDGFLKG